MYIEKLKVIVEMDKINLIKSDKRIFSCGKKFENILKVSIFLED